MSKDKVINLRVDQEMIEELERAAEKISKAQSIGGLKMKDLSRSEVITILIRLGISNLDKIKSK